MPSWTGIPYTMNMSRKPRALYCRYLFLVMWMALCSGTEDETALTSLLNNVYSVIEDKLLIPYCFTATLYDITCFWESNTSNTSNYMLYFQSDGETCSLETVAASNGTWWHICQFPGKYVSLFLNPPHHITLIDNWENSSKSRKVWTEKIIYLDPIKSITVKEQMNPLGLLVIVNATDIDLLSLTYEVKYTQKKSDVQKIKFLKVKEQQPYAKIFLPDIVRGTEYTISVRVKADGEFDGYWSQWMNFDVQVSSAVDVLQVTLYVIAGLIPIVAIILLTTCQRRFLKKKVWPKIPSPEHHFKELYTTHKGNFKLWLDQTDAYLMWISRNIFYEGPISTLEVLSELPNGMPSPPSSAQLPPKDSYVTIDDTFLPNFPALMVTQRQINGQMELLSPIEPPSHENTSSSEERPEEDVREMTNEEVLPVEESKSYPTKEKPGSLTILREDSLNSEEGKQSPGSSFEYTVLETCNGLLSPRTRSIPPRQPLKYAYLLMSDSGKESPPPSPNIYQNSICAQLPTHIYSQC
ncbi:erythropoietin receptor isoform X2 [Rhinoderma darwinii]|uniref:erythropoietin receptor isoform X2 n=1 Tax=Rhinoderma darwinii TaxID=43563 RepID=UPI003F668A5F